MMLTSPWRLSLLFLVSGVATAYLLARQGAGHFMGQRSTRLLIPLAFGMLVIVPPQSYLEVVEKLRYAGSFAEFYRLYITGFHGFCRGGDCLIMPTWNHSVVRRLSVGLHGGALCRGSHRAARDSQSCAGLPSSVCPALGCCSGRSPILSRSAWSLAPRFPATHALVGDWYNHAMYFGVFLLGFLAGRAPAPRGARWSAPAG